MSNNRLTYERISEIQMEAALLHEHVVVAGEAMTRCCIKEEEFLNSLTAAEFAALSTPFEIDGKKYQLEKDYHLTSKDIQEDEPPWAD